MVAVFLKITPNNYVNVKDKVQTNTHFKTKIVLTYDIELAFFKKIQFFINTAQVTNIRILLNATMQHPRAARHLISGHLISDI